jgi:hypothetical protein
MDSKQIGAVQAAIKSYGDNSNAVASKEFFKNVARQGQELTDTALGGAKGDAQRALGTAMGDFEAELAAAGDDPAKQKAVMDKFGSKFSAYADSFKGLKGKALEEALSAGGSTGSQAYAALMKKEKFGSKKYASVEDAAKDFGVDVKDVYAAGFKPGETLSKEALESLTAKGGSERALADAQGGTKVDKPKSKDDTLIDTLTKQNEILSKLSTKLDTDKKGFFAWGSSDENANADPKKGNSKLPGETG